MASPYDLFCRYLLTQGADDLNALNEALAEHRCLPVSQESFDAQFEYVSRLPESVREQIRTGKHEGSFPAWMKTIGLDEVYATTKTPTWGKILTILQDPQAKNALNALLTKRAKPDQTAQIINQKYSLGISGPETALYGKIFWDPSRMPREAWRAYLRGAAEAERAILMVALSEPLEFLKSYLELPAKTSTSEMLQHLMAMSYLKAKQYLRQSGPTTNAEARAWIATTEHLATKYEKFKSGDVQDFAKELEMTFDYVETNFDTPDEEILKEVTRKAGVEESDKENT